MLFCLILVSDDGRLIRSIYHQPNVRDDRLHYPYNVSDDTSIDGLKTPLDQDEYSELLAIRQGGFFA